MKALEYIQIFSSNVRREGFRLSSAQVILAILSGEHRHSTIVSATQLHPNTVTNILKDLINQHYIKRFGTEKPYVYRVSERGEQLGMRLLKKREDEPIHPLYANLWKKTC